MCASCMVTHNGVDETRLPTLGFAFFLSFFLVSLSGRMGVGKQTLSQGLDVENANNEFT